MLSIVPSSTAFCDLSWYESRKLLLTARRCPTKWVCHANRTECGPAMWMTAAFSISASAVSNAELPLPMMRTRWAVNDSGSVSNVS